MQGLSETLAGAGTIKLTDVSIASKMEIGHIIAVSLDGGPLATSKKILLQVMSEEKTNGFATEPATSGKRIVRIGGDPWLVREFDGVVRLHRPEAAKLKVTALDQNGLARRMIGTADRIVLEGRPSIIS